MKKIRFIIAEILISFAVLRIMPKRHKSTAIWLDYIAQASHEIIAEEKEREAHEAQKRNQH